MLEIMTGEISKGCEWKNIIHNDKKTIDKYSQIKRFNHNFWIQVYMYDFMYIGTDTIP